MNLDQSLIKRVFKRFTDNLWFFLTNELSELNLRIKNQEKIIKTLSEENIFLIKTCFDQDEWLLNAKDLHKGERCFLLGTGPSLNKLDLSRLNTEYNMGVNGTCLIENVQLEYFISVSHIWWEHHSESIKKLICKRRFLAPYIEVGESDSPTSWLRVIEQQNHRRVTDSVPWFFSMSPHRYVVLGGTVIFVALQILYHMGFKEIIICGLDHDYGIQKNDLGKHGSFIPTENLNAHFTPDYYKQGGNLHLDLEAMERSYKLAHEIYTSDSRTVLNASPGTKLDIFPKVEFDSLFQ